MSNKKLGLIDNWLRYIRDVRTAHAKELASITDDNERANRLVEFKYDSISIVNANDSVLAQVNSAKRIPTVQDAMETRGLQVHGWVYDVSNGRLKSLEIGQDVDHSNYEVFTSKESLE
jgi:carbonic anhydrase